MLRALTLFIIILNNFRHIDKFHSGCSANEIQTNSIISTLIRYMRKFRDIRQQSRNSFPGTTEETVSVNKLPENIESVTQYHISIERLLQNNVELDNKMNTTQLIKSHGYRKRSYDVETIDGHILKIHKILPWVREKKNQAIILHHGLLGSAEDWLLLGPGKALPYLLADRGYDVWLLNARGSKYSGLCSCAHSYKQSTYWNFSWHEMGIYDLPASIKFISRRSANSDLFYIGHSMGATALLVLLSTYRQYNHMFKAAILLAPLAFMYNSKGPLRHIVELSNRPDLPIKSVREISRIMIKKYCRASKMSCANPLLLLTNGGINITDAMLMANILTHVPAGGSMKTMVHYLQLIESGHFRRFDYGYSRNHLKYDGALPPAYNLKGISVPISLFTSESDWLTQELDVKKLIFALKNVQFHHSVKRNGFGHMDFIWSQSAGRLIYRHVMNILEEYKCKPKMPERKSSVIHTKLKQVT
ncbi:lipase 3-like [Anticarsia gemmatalis]|uniref:lipase 3-like n=1 Tax=Anticarsia gemmatalis TaxID=129554 RepID=UPI003F76CFDE